jgi:hypothetical protein
MIKKKFMITKLTMKRRKRLSFLMVISLIHQVMMTQTQIQCPMCKINLELSNNLKITRIRSATKKELLHRICQNMKKL